MEELNRESHPLEGTKPGRLSDELCHLMQQIGLPALRIYGDKMEVVDFNALFADLVAATGIRDYRFWFVDAVLPSMNKIEKAEWLAATARFVPANACVRFTLRNGQRRDFEMRSAGAIQDAVTPLIVCVFLSLPEAPARTRYESWLARGQATERARIRNELHNNVSQKLLGAAFGCKLLAGKAKGLDESFAQEASALAELLNAAVVDLQNLTRPGKDSE